MSGWSGTTTTDACDHAKSYRSLCEEQNRFQIFKENLKIIREHNERYNRGEESYFMKVTQFADLSKSEFKKLLTLNSQALQPNLKDDEWIPSNEEAPESLDWRKQGIVAYNGHVESQLSLTRKVNISLSEQQLIDCSSSYGNTGCQGGLMSEAYIYMQEHGMVSEEEYPYEAADGTCRSDGKKIVARVGTIKNIPDNDEDIKKAVAFIGPIAVGIKADELQLFGGGIYKSRGGDCVLDHGVVLVGYDSVGDGEDYWIVKNSWGTQWGEGGYGKLSRNNDEMCGVHAAQFVTLV
nr:unnamed protein product [Callosobruchus analis]